MITIATKLNQELANPVEPFNSEAITNLAYTSEGALAPLTAAMGGIVAQEVLKALTGKFTPLNQWVSHLSTRSRDVNIKELYICEYHGTMAWG